MELRVGFALQQQKKHVKDPGDRLRELATQIDEDHFMR